jgi:small subunit ribosomal protein S9
MADTFYGTGKRKNAIARVWLIPGGTGVITVNNKPVEEYFGRITLQQLTREPFEKVTVGATFVSPAFHLRGNQSAFGTQKTLLL